MSIDILEEESFPLAEERIYEEDDGAQSSETPESSVAEIRAATLDCVESWLERAALFGYAYWKGSDFEAVDLPENAHNEIHIGLVKHQEISTNPRLVATLFPQKFGKPGNLKQGINLVICKEPLLKEDLVSDYDATTNQEIISFNVEFEYDGDGRHVPGRHSLKNRLIHPDYKGDRFGSKILKLYDNFFQKRANEKKEKQSNIIHTSVLETMHWAERNGYIPDTNDDRVLWEDIGKNPFHYPLVEDGMIDAFVIFRKDFVPEEV